MSERTIGHAPATVERPDEVLGGHPRVGEEDLVEVQVLLTAHVGERPAHDTRGVGGNDQRADALVLRRVRVGAYERQQEVRVVGAGCPHLLSVDHEVVTGQNRAGPQRRQVGAGAGLAHAERRGQFGLEHRHRPAVFLLVGAERNQRRRNDVHTLRIEAVVDPATAQFVEMHELLQHGRLAAAELRRLCGQQPAVVEQQPLPVARPLRHVRHRPRPLQGQRLGRQVLVEERRELGTELLDVGIKSQLHRIPPRSSCDVRRRRRAAARRPWLASARTEDRSPT